MGWYISIDGSENGPFNGGQLVKFAQQQRINGNTMLYHKERTKGEWVCASDIRELRTVFDTIAAHQDLLSRQAADVVADLPTAYAPPVRVVRKEIERSTDNMPFIVGAVICAAVLWLAPFMTAYYVGIFRLQLLRCDVGPFLLVGNAVMTMALVTLKVGRSLSRTVAMIWGMLASGVGVLMLLSYFQRSQAADNAMARMPVPVDRHEAQGRELGGALAKMIIENAHAGEAIFMVLVGGIGLMAACAMINTRKP